MCAHPARCCPARPPVGAGGNVDRITRRKSLPGLGEARDDLARVDADAGFECDAVVALKLFVQDVEPRAHLRRGVQSASGVVLVQGRDAEHRHHCIADELLDRAAVALEDGLLSRRSSAT
jgi:hypothetical protein